MKRWGLQHFSWVFLPYHTLYLDCSNVWLNVCKAWNQVKKQLFQPHLPTSLSWSVYRYGCHTYNTPTAQVLAAKQLCSNAFFRLGFPRFATNVDGQVLDWHSKSQTDLPDDTKLTDNIHPVELPTILAPRVQLVYVASSPLQADCIVWEFQMTREERGQRWLPGELSRGARQAFHLNNGLLSKWFHSEPP